jgi:superfamily II DNA helicase RecQ
MNKSNTACGGRKKIKKMQFRIFTFSVFDENKIEEMNRFLRGNKIINAEKQFVTLENCAYWSFCIHYTGMEAKDGAATSEPKAKTDYKNVLDEATFAVFSKLRVYRKKIAESDAVPAYAVFTDAELSEIAKLDEITEKKLIGIQGIGEKRVEKYGKLLCNMLKEEKEE